jgi:formimidoylglutamate deiminase
MQQTSDGWRCQPSAWNQNVEIELDLCLMNRLIARRALLPAGWKSNVLLEWDVNGILTAVADGAGPSNGVPVVDGVVLPGMPNLHSHAFQRAMAGLTEYRSHPTDSFWSWRTLMYSFAQKVSPQALKAIAVQLYIEMLKAGYTSVCEFHYVHHDTGGKPYANPCEMAECLVAAAAEAGIGLTLLPVMYQYSGFGARPFHAGQARFINSPEWMMDLLERMQRSHPQHAGLRYGVAPHSLRAVSPESLRELLAALDRWDSRAPVHIHIAEQTKEVDDSVACLGARPVEWLLANAEVDQRWCLVHATHMTQAETAALARSGAVAGICPTTEANLGDGVFNGVAYAAANGAWGIGSDSNVSTSVAEELRIYEYSQRLLHRQRNILVSDSGGSVGAYLYGGAVRGGAAATGRQVAGLEVGQRADLVVLDDAHPDLLGRDEDALLDSLIFCNHGPTPVRDVMTGGKWVIQDRRHRHQEASMAAYGAAVKGLLTA